MAQSQNKFNLYQILHHTVRDEKPVALTSVINNETGRDIRAGAKMLVFSDGKVEGSLGNADLESRVRKDALELLSKEKSKTLAYELESGQKVEVYIEAILPPPPLVIIGADPDAVPIVSLGKQLGFKVVLVDHRPNFANSEKYPDVDEAIVSPIAEISQNVKLDEKTFVLIKTHNYLKDKEILKLVLRSNARYVGQLGPKARMEDLLHDLFKEGVKFSEEQLQKLYAPVGLDIGAESPEQIALSILGEMLAVRSGRKGGFLRNQASAIHPRD